jgi:hypothetical protein
VSPHARRADLAQRVRALSWFTLIWLAIDGAVGMTAGVAANSVALVDNAQADVGSPLTVAGNLADKISAVGGTALVNALGAYRGARLVSSPLVIAGNTASDISAGGASGQVLGAGSVRNGILVANGIYMEGEGGVRLSGSPVSIRGDDARSIDANGGRVYDGPDGAEMFRLYAEAAAAATYSGPAAQSRNRAEAPVGRPARLHRLLHRR